MNAALVFHALGDPVRLGMIQTLARHQPCTVARVCKGQSITRQGARKHLQVLVDAKLAVLKTHGREVHVRLASRGLEHAQAFLSRLELQWDRRLESLRRSLEGA